VQQDAIEELQAPNNLNALGRCHFKRGCVLINANQAGECATITGGLAAVVLEQGTDKDSIEESEAPITIIPRTRW
jgi:hypothetical protein